MAQDNPSSKLANAAPLLAAIAETQNFSKAADLLNVHQSAVSHRTKALEEALGFKLFERTTRQLRFTPEGEILCRAATETSAIWKGALTEIENLYSDKSIRLSLPSSLAMKWLIPSLPSAASMGIDIALQVSEEHTDFKSNDVDAAIRFGTGPYPGLFSVHLAHSEIQPVASTAYLNARENSISQLDDHNAIFLADRRGASDETDFSWGFYFSKERPSNSEIIPDFQFERADLMLQAAINGLGIGLGRSLLVENDISAGFLKPLGSPVKMRSSYWLVCKAEFAKTDQFIRLQNWLKAEINKTLGNRSNEIEKT
ncbi:MAG: LysR family transcriptional regulator [Sneathiella sp.]